MFSKLLLALVISLQFIVPYHPPSGSWQKACTTTTADGADTTVQTAINAAVAGNVICIPTGSWTWTSTVTITGKAITLQGAGIGLTNITDGVSGNPTLNASVTTTNFVNVSGVTWIKGSDKANGQITFDGTAANVGFRFHHNRILVASGGSHHAILITGVYGLLDHNTFDVTATTGSLQMVSPYGSGDGNDGGFTPWTRALSLGTNNAVYIEDNAFNYSTGIAGQEDGIDAYGGARLVIRYNTFLNVTVGFHGTDSGDRRSVFSYEIYNNIFTNNSGTTLRASTLRGGTGVIDGNVYGGSHGSWNEVTMMVYRACPPLDQSSWQTCNGTNWQIGSTSFSAQASRTAAVTGSPQQVKFCSGDRDLVCTADATCSAAGAGTCSTYFDGAGTSGYACRDQVGRSHGQALEPLYVWSNTGISGAGGYDGGESCGVGLGNYLQAGRDYYTDGTSRPGYTPYSYPHPLQSN